MTKQEMQALIDTKNRQIEDLRRHIEALESDSDESVRASRLYQMLESECRSAREDAVFWKKSCAIADKENGRLKAQVGRRLSDSIQKILDDNRRLLNEQGVAYWIGITQSGDAEVLEKLERENLALRKDNGVLREKLQSMENYTDHLEHRISEINRGEFEYVKIESRSVGRPIKATQTQIEEARKYRKQGYSIREISLLTERLWGKDNRWSVGYTQKILSDIKPSAAAIKKHNEEKKGRDV